MLPPELKALEGGGGAATTGAAAGRLTMKHLDRRWSVLGVKVWPRGSLSERPTAYSLSIAAFQPCLILNKFARGTRCGVGSRMRRDSSFGLTWKSFATSSVTIA
jgi:hypothetical protein